VVGILVSIPIESMMGPFQRQLLERLINSQPDIPVETRDMIERASAGGRGVVGFVFKLLVMLTTGTIFGTLGGLLGVAVFKKDAPPPPPPGTVEILPPE
jgi:hypothetical protein